MIAKRTMENFFNVKFEAKEQMLKINNEALKSECLSQISLIEDEMIKNIETNIHLCIYAIHRLKNIIALVNKEDKG